MVISAAEAELLEELNTKVADMNAFLKKAEEQGYSVQFDGEAYEIKVHSVFRNLIGDMPVAVKR